MKLRNVLLLIGLIFGLANPCGNAQPVTNLLRSLGNDSAILLPGRHTAPMPISMARLFMEAHQPKQSRLFLTITT